MTKSDLQLNMLSSILFSFSNNLIREIKDIKKILKRIGIDDKKAVPPPFNSENISVKAYYSIDRDQYFIMFNEKVGPDDYVFLTVKGNPIPVSVLEIGPIQKEAIFSELTLKKGLNNIYLEYALLFSYEGFLKRLNQTKEFAIEIVKNTIDYNRYTALDEKMKYAYYLVGLKKQMQKLFFDETIGELVIDHFIEQNPIILEHGLNLIKPNHQVILKNILGLFEHDLKPDLIAFDLMEKNWVIVDYKKAKRTIIKNLGKVRTGFKAEVNDLENQLLDYIEYFEEREHRDHVSKTNKLSIKDPNAIGIIGNVNEEELSSFIRLMKNKPRWFKVVPYNFFYDHFSRYVEDYIRNFIK